MRRGIFDLQSRRACFRFLKQTTFSCTPEESKMTEGKNGDQLSSDKVVTEKEKVDFTEGGPEEFKFYPDNPKNHRHKYRWVNKDPSKYYDPCEESRQASINCVLRNQEDKSVCQEFFDAYRECTRDFFAKKKQDRQSGKKGWGLW